MLAIAADAPLAHFRRVLGNASPRSKARRWQLEAGRTGQDLDASDSSHDDGLDQELLLRPGRVQSPDDLHALDDLAESGEALSIRIAAPSVVELGLLADADEEFRRGRSWTLRAIETVPSRCLRRVC